MVLIIRWSLGECQKKCKNNGSIYNNWESNSYHNMEFVIITNLIQKLLYEAKSWIQINNFKSQLKNVFVWLVKSSQIQQLRKR